MPKDRRHDAAPQPPQDEERHPWSGSRDDEQEPDWAREIRERRKARGDRLKEIFDGFTEQDLPRRSPSPTEDELP